MKTLGIIIARRGSKGLPGKNMVHLLGRPLIDYTIEHAQAARGLDELVVSTDWPELAAIAQARGVRTIQRPDSLAHDTATVDAAARHAVQTVEARTGSRFDAVVILYGNIPLRPAGLIERGLAKLLTSGGDSVQSVYPVGKIHPLWMRILTGQDEDRIEPYQPNSIYRRQDLPPVYMLDAGLIAVRRDSLFRVIEGQPHAFLGDDRRAIVTQPGEVMDVDDATDLAVAETLLRRQGHGQSLKSPAIEIAGRMIAKGQLAYVIAELGVNHDGSLSRAIELTKTAREAGADAVKLQLFDPRMLLSREAALADYQRAAAPDVFEMLAALELSVEEVAQVGEVARNLGMGFILTCFSPAMVRQVNQLQPDAVKIASPDAVNLPLLDALAGVNRPMIVSTGGCDLCELAPLIELSRQIPLAAMQCVSAYPARIEDAALGGIQAIADYLRVPVGYSDHTMDEHTGMLAVAAGACLIEKHLTHDRAAPGPDHAASFDSVQFARYVQLIRKTQTMRGPIEKRLLPCEREVRTLSRQSLCAARDLPAGTVLTREHLTVKRPGTGIPAAQLTRVLGRRLARRVRADTLLRPADLAGEENLNDTAIESAA